MKRLLLHGEQQEDDTTTYTASREIFENLAVELVDTVQDWGMTVSVKDQRYSGRNECS